MQSPSQHRSPQRVTRPEETPRPCSACGAPVDPLRAREIAIWDDATLYFCDRACRERYPTKRRAPALDDSDPLRPHPAVAASLASATALPLGPHLEGAPAGVQGRTTRPREIAPQTIGERVLTNIRTQLNVQPRAYWVALASGALALLSGLLSKLPVFGYVSATASIIGSIALGITALRDSERAMRVVWCIGPLGVLVASLAAIAERWSIGPTFAPFGISLALLIMLIRVVVDHASVAPVKKAAARLGAQLPRSVRVPLQEASSALALHSHVVDAHRIRVGEEILVLEGEMVAVDGVVRAGEAMVLLHPYAREPSRRQPGDPLLAGATVVEGAVRVLVTRTGDDRGLVRPQRFGVGTEPESANLARLVDQIGRFGALITPFLGGFALLFSAESLLVRDLYAFSAVLIAVPLVALRRGVELPMTAAAASAGARGIVFVNGKMLENAGRSTVCTLCPHGTLTEGLPEVVEVHSVDGGSIEPLVALAAATEMTAPHHPVAKAIFRFAEARSIAFDSVRRSIFFPGRGLTSLASNGEPFVIGNRQLLLDEGVSVAIADSEAKRAETRGHRVVFIALGGKLRALVSLRDEERAGARAAVQRLMDLHIEVVLLSGDHRASTEALAKGFDIAHVKAELSPEERGLEVQRLRETGGMVASIGRPDEDEAALLAADVPIMLGSAGGATNERGISLATDDLRDAAAGLWIARAARRVATRSAFIAVGTGGFAVMGAMLGLISPAVAAVLALLVDLLVIPSGRRLLHRIELRVPSR